MIRKSDDKNGKLLKDPAPQRDDGAAAIDPALFEDRNGHRPKEYPNHPLQEQSGEEFLANVHRQEALDHESRHQEKRGIRRGMGHSSRGHRSR